MLWSDDEPDTPSPEARRAQAMLRRAMLVLALAAGVAMVIAAWHA
ncbi:morphogenic membrane protein MmpB [Actinacidiphila acididurans]|nr:hypothetical protein [Actinacidiphila acididurans]